MDGSIGTGMDRKERPRIVLLNAIVPPSFDGAILISHIPIDGAKDLVRVMEFESYVGHEATAQMLSAILGVNVPFNRGMYNPRDGDLALVFRLRKRLEKPEDVKNITPNDIEVLLIKYVSLTRP